MSTEGTNTRSAILRIRHPENSGVFDDVTFTQAQSTPSNETFTISWVDSITNASISTESLSYSGVAGSTHNFIKNITYDAGYVFGSAYSLDADAFSSSFTFNSQFDGTTVGGTLTMPAGGGSATITVDGAAALFSGTPAGPSGPSGTSDNGCHLAGTMIEMSDGTFKAIENIEVGDSVRSITLSGLSQEENAWTTWSTPIADFGSNHATAVVQSINQRQFNAYRSINNDLLKITYEHPLLSKKDDVVAYRQVQHLEVGDSLWYRNAQNNMEWLEITSMTVEQLENEAIFDTWTIDVENEDGYFANGVVAHNVVAVIDDGDDDGKTLDPGLPIA